MQINLWSQKVAVGDCRERGKDEGRRSNRDTAGIRKVPSLLWDPMLDGIHLVLAPHPLPQIGRAHV